MMIIKPANMLVNLFSLVLLMCICLVQLKTFPQSIRQEWNKFEKPAVTKCICESGVKPDLVQKMIQHSEYTNDPCFKLYMQCLNIERGLIDGNGNIIVNGIVLHMTGVTYAIAEKCVNETSLIQDPAVKVYETGLCVMLMLST